MSDQKKYQPISCVFYDLIEHYAVRKEPITILLKDEPAGRMKLTTRILDTRAKEGVEYLLLENPREWFRMDRIISLNDDKLSDFQDC